MSLGGCVQDRYVGDVGDFAKYALLRALTTDGALRLGVIWHLFPDEGHNGDGRHVAYLTDGGLAERDPSLHERLAALVAEGRRRVAEVEASGILPPSTSFHSDLVRFAGPPAERIRARGAWMSDALAAVAASDLVFVDPDNGVQPAGVAPADPRAGKYVLWDELDLLWSRGHSLVVYHHLNRSAPAAMQTARLAAAFAARMSRLGPVSLLFRRGSCRHLWVLAQDRHRPALDAGLKQFLAAGWSTDSELERHPVATTAR